MKKIKDILINIESGVSLTPAQNKKITEYFNKHNEERDEYFNVEIIKINKKKEFFYEIKDKEKHNEFFKDLKDETLSNREMAAAVGDSHKAKCSKGLLQLRECNDNVVGLSIELPNKDLKPSSEIAIIIENLETFTNREFIKKLSIKNLESANIIFGSGAEINNSYFKEYLSHYKIIYCLFDWDEKGFSFYNSLKGNGQNVIWHTEERFFNVKPKKTKEMLLSDNQINNLREKYRNVFGVRKSLNFITERGSRVEQELFHKL